MVRRREQKHKLEPSFDGPFQVVRILPHRTYTLKSLNGQTLKNNYHADLLLPAYTFERQPIDSPFYSSPRLLKELRSYIANEANLNKSSPVPVNFG